MIRERVKRGVAQHTNQLVVYVDMHAFDDGVKMASVRACTGGGSWRCAKHGVRRVPTFVSTHSQFRSLYDQSRTRPSLPEGCARTRSEC